MSPLVVEVPWNLQISSRGNFEQVLMSHSLEAARREFQACIRSVVTQGVAGVSSVVL